MTILLEILVLMRISILLFVGTMLLIGPPVPETYQNQPHLLLVDVQTVTTAFLSRHLLVSMLAPQALVALAEWRAMP